MAAINYGVGYVAPSGGSDSNNGYGPDTPMQHIQNAVSAGFDHIVVAPGTHNVSSITDQTTIEFMPGTHTFSNAPVSVTKPVNLISAQLHPPALDGTGAAKITAPSSVNSFFSYDTASSAIFGGYIRGLWFDLSKINSGRGAIEFHAVNDAVWEDCIGYRATYGNRYLFYMGTNDGGDDQSWNHLHRNTSWNAGMFYGVVLPETHNRWTWRDNVSVAPNGDASARFYNLQDTRHQGQLFEGLTLEGSTASAGIFIDRAKMITAIGNHVSGMNNPANIFIHADVASTGPISSHFIHARGINAQGGTIKPDTSSPPTPGTETYDSAKDNRFDIIDYQDNIS